MTLAETQGYRATEEQWEKIEAFAKGDPNWEAIRAILELRSRIQALETWQKQEQDVAMDFVTSEVGPKTELAEERRLRANNWERSGQAQVAMDAPSQAAETTTEETHLHEWWWRWMGQLGKRVLDPASTDVAWCTTCGALLLEAVIHLPKSAMS